MKRAELEAWQMRLGQAIKRLRKAKKLGQDDIKSVHRNWVYLVERTNKDIRLSKLVEVIEELTGQNILEGVLYLLEAEIESIEREAERKTQRDSSGRYPPG